ncbi:LLM class flavin-dependent oxidoreductase [Micromonospora sp. NPDC007208]|uniref:LLM class flavin-dependent oxidoreductase n=1 Tax=Micromonospora sp. NPDC007208 TaxID=3364236 RepID=UPI003695565F
MEYYIKLRDVPDVEHLRQKVRLWEDIGVSGVTVSDHLYTSRDVDKERAVQRRHDPYVLLGAVGALSARLNLAVLVANSSYSSPYLTIRHFVELARLYGGRRVYAGFGAGWNAEEFDVLGMEMPPHAQRVERLAQTVAAARSLFDTGGVSLDGSDLTLRRAPLSPSVDEPPRLAVGGGSSAVIRVAAAHADHLDFDAPAHRLPLTRSVDGAITRSRDLERRMLTTFDDLARMRRYLDEQLTANGRARAAVTTSINITALRIQERDAADWLTALNDTYSLRLHEGHVREASRASPFFLLGSASAIRERIARYRAELGMKFLVLPDSLDTERLLRGTA